MPQFNPLHPKKYREKYGLTRQQVSLKSKISPNTLKNWLADTNSGIYREPPETVKLYFGLLDALENSAQ